jgi:hypothetical protein
MVLMTHVLAPSEEDVQTSKYFVHKLKMWELNINDCQKLSAESVSQKVE